MSFKRYARRPYIFCRKYKAVSSGGGGGFDDPPATTNNYTDGPNFEAHIRTLSAEQRQRAGITATTKIYRLITDHPVPLSETQRFVYSDEPIPDRPEAGGVPLDRTNYNNANVKEIIPFPGRKVDQFDIERTA